MKRIATLAFRSNRGRGTWIILLLSSWMLIVIVLGIGVLNLRQHNVITQDTQGESNTFLNGILRGCNGFGVRFVLIEPDVLSVIEGQRQSVPLSARNHTAVAVTADQVEDLMLALSRLKNQSSTAWSMSTSTLNCSAGANRFIRESLPCTLYASKPAHLLLEMNGTRVHVVVLFSRGSFYWTAPLSSSLSHLLNGTSYGRGSYALERFVIREILVISAGPVDVPADIRAFLFQYGQSEFIECDPTVVDHVSKLHADMVPRNTSKRDQLWLKDMLLVKHTFESRGRHIWLFDGTLLGWSRECGFVAHTRDVDMAADPREFSEEFTNGLLNRKESFKICIYKINETGHVAVEFNLYCASIKVDVFYVVREKDFMWTGYYGSTTVYRANYPLVDKLCSGELVGHRFTVPCNAEEIMRKEYGPNWLKPVFTGSWWNIEKTNYTYDYKCYR